MSKKIIVCGLLAFSSLYAHAGDPRDIADVVGRDIDTIYFGHIGMWTGANVLEVLSNPGIIFENSLASFKDQRYDAKPTVTKKYWGAKAANLSATLKQYVISSGRAQKAYAPQYTTSSSFTEGMYKSYCIQYGRYGECVQSKTYLVPAVFRCDTFVQYSYKKGASYIASGLWPINVYNSFPITR